MTFDQFIAKYKGKGVGYPNDNYFKGECLSLTKWHIKEVYGIDPPPSGCNGARCYWSIFPSPLNTIFKKVPNTPDLIPKKGWIAVWNGNVGGGAGHIGSVADDKATKTTFNSFDQNWGSRKAQIVTHNYNNVYGFLVPLKEDTMSDYEEAIRKAVAYDEVCQLLGQPSTTTAKETTDKLSKIISDKDRYQKERDQARQERDNYAEENKGLNTQVELLKKDITSLNNELEKCLSEVPTEESLEKDFEITGRKIIKTTGDTVVETSYRVKE